MTDLTNKTLGNFSISHTLGTGGMGTVYKARDTMLDIPVAIKVMHPQFAQQTSLQQRFQQEARSAAAVEHPNIVRVRHFDQQGPHLYMVMEYIPGDNLRDILNALLEKKEWLVLPEALTLVRTVCLAISHAHCSGVIHRDIKPANIMLKPDEESEYGYRPVITDLGLAKMMGAAGITQTDEIMGTPAYMSPEQVLGPNEAIGAASDIYALGVLLYELATSTPPFRATRISEVINYHTQEPATYPDPQTLRPDLPDAIESIMRRALMRQPSERFASANEMGIALDRMLQQRLPHTLPTSVSTVRGLATVHQQSIIAQRGHSLLDQFEHAPPSPTTQDGIQIVTPSGNVQFLPIDFMPITVGREEDNRLVLRDDPKLSRYHACIEYEDDVFYALDNASTNGVYLDERILPPNQRTEWPAGSILRIGNHHLRIIAARISTQPAFLRAKPTGSSDKFNATLPYPSPLPNAQDQAGATPRQHFFFTRLPIWAKGLFSLALFIILGGFIFLKIESNFFDKENPFATVATSLTPTTSVLTVPDPMMTANIIEPTATVISESAAIENGMDSDADEPLESTNNVTHTNTTLVHIETSTPSTQRSTDLISTTTATPRPTPLIATSTATPLPPEPQSGELQVFGEMNLVYVPSGAFIMGSTDAEMENSAQLCRKYYGSGCQPDWTNDEGPQSSVSTSAFWIMQTEVTNNQFRQFVESDGYAEPSYWSALGWQWKIREGIMFPAYWADPSFNGGSHPVVGVSWYEATAYATWIARRTGLEFRLPTEAEWEKAARGVNGHRYPWGPIWDPNFANYCDVNCDQKWKDISGFSDQYPFTSPVGQFPSGKSPYNVYDMAGNVWEWTASIYGPYPYAQTGRESVDDGSRRTLRGGSWRSAELGLRSADRAWKEPTVRTDRFGIRLVLSTE